MKKCRTSAYAVLFAMVAGLGCDSIAADWPTYRGDSARSSIGTEKELSKDWSKHPPRQVWEAYGFGEGHGSPVIAGGTLFLQGGGYLIAVDAATGAVKWRQRNGGTSTTPTAQGERIYTQADGFVYCYEGRDGRLVWKKGLVEQMPEGKDYPSGVRYGDWYGSPLVVDGKVFALAGHPQALLVAFKVEDGEVLWRATVKEAVGRGWASPVLAEHGGERLIVTHTSWHLIGVNIEDGRVYWEQDLFLAVGGRREGLTAANAPVIHDGYIFCASGYGKISWNAFRFGGSVKDLTKAWYNPSIQPHQEGMVCVDGLLFGTGDLSWQDVKANPDLRINGKSFDEFRAMLAPMPAQVGVDRERERFRTVTNLASGVFQGRAFVCQELKTGKTLGARYGIPSHGYWGMTPVFADGILYVAPSSDTQCVYLVEATPDLSVRGILTLPAPDPAKKSRARYRFDTPFTTPAISDGIVYLRWHDRIVAVDIRSPERTAREDDVATKAMPGLFDAWLAAGNGDARAEAMNTLMSRFLRIRGRAPIEEFVLNKYRGADKTQRQLLLGFLPSLPTEATIAAVRQAKNDSDAVVAEAATMALTAWPDPAALPDLLDTLSTKPSDRIYRVAFEGAVRLASLDNAGTGVSRLDNLKKLYNLARSDEDKAAPLVAVCSIPLFESFEWARGCLGDKSKPARVAAGRTVVELAPKVFDRNPVVVASTVASVQDKCDDAAVKAAAVECHKELIRVAAEKGILNSIIESGAGTGAATADLDGL